MKVIYFLASVSLLVGGGFLLWRYQNHWQRPATASAAERAKSEALVRRIYWEDVNRAKAENKEEIILPSAQQLPWNIKTWEQVLERYSLLRVKIKDAETIATEPDPTIEVVGIDTWYKFEVLEVLHQRQPEYSEEPSFVGAPIRLLPLLPGEGLLRVNGGTITVDGVKVVRSVGSEEAHLFLQREYLIPADLYHGGQLIRAHTSAASTFLIDGAKFSPLRHKQSQIARDVEQKYNNDLACLHAGLQLRSRQSN